MRGVVPLVLLASATSFLAIVEGCTGDSTFRCPDDPTNPAYDDPGCVKLRQKDAGADGADGSSPGASPQSAVCVLNPPNGFSGPTPLWHGPKNNRPSACPEQIGAYGSEGFSDLIAPALDCPTCVCKASDKVSCPPTPIIEVRSEICDVAAASSIDFSPAIGWDGSCTNAKTLAAGAECPPGSGQLCAVSVFSGPLPGPINECEPDELPVLKGWDNLVRWDKAALSCSASEAAPPGAPCGDVLPSCGADESCRYELPAAATKDEGWRWCVYQSGVVDCPNPSKFKERIVVYEDAAIEDSRTCTACSCSGEGGTCYGTLRVYEDEMCSSATLARPKDSTTPECSNLLGASGHAIGSIAMTDPLYVPGSCKPSGGVPAGGVTLNPEKAVTWCCQPPKADTH